MCAQDPPHSHHGHGPPVPSHTRTTHSSLLIFLPYTHSSHSWDTCSQASLNRIYTNTVTCLEAEPYSGSTMNLMAPVWLVYCLWNLCKKAQRTLITEEYYLICLTRTFFSPCGIHFHFLPSTRWHYGDSTHWKSAEITVCSDVILNHLEAVERS